MRAVVVLRLVVLYLAGQDPWAQYRAAQVAGGDAHQEDYGGDWLPADGWNQSGWQDGQTVEVVFHLLLLVFLHVVSREDLRLRWGTFPLRGKCPMVLTCRCRM